MGYRIITRLKECISCLIPDAVSYRFYLKQFDQSESPLKWQPGPRCPQRRVEANGVILNGRLYLFGGYVSIGEVSNLCHIFDFGTEKWVGDFAIPEGVPQTHFGVATDGKRYIYTVGGQIGPHCSPCTDSVYVYDTVEGTWDTLQSLGKAFSLA